MKNTHISLITARLTASALPFALSVLSTAVEGSSTAALFKLIGYFLPLTIAFCSSVSFIWMDVILCLASKQYREYSIFSGLSQIYAGLLTMGFAAALPIHFEQSTYLTLIYFFGGFTITVFGLSLLYAARSKV